MDNNHTLSRDLLVKRKRGRPRKYPTIESNVHCIGPFPGSSMTQPQIFQRDTYSGDFMTKQKQGRPRKHQNIGSNSQSTGPPGFSMHHPQIRQRNNDKVIVGQPIHCKIEETFEDRFFISVKVDNSDSVLRGVVFKPGRCVHVSGDNVAAPHLPSIRRNVVHPHASANRVHKYTVGERRDNGDISLVPVLIQQSQPAHLTIPTHHVVPVVRGRSLVLVPPQPALPDSGENTDVFTVSIQYAENDHHGSGIGGRKYTIPERHDSGDRSLVSNPIQYFHHALPIQNDHHSSSNGGRYTVRERRDSGGRSLVHAPIQHAHLTNPAQHTLAPVSAQRAHVHVPAPLAQPTLVPILAPSAHHARVPFPAPPIQRTRVPIPAPPAQGARVPVPAPPAQSARVPVPAPPAQDSRVPVHAPPTQDAQISVHAPHAHPTISAHHVVPVILQPFHQQNVLDGVPTHQAIVRNPVVSVKRPAPHLRLRLPVSSGPMQTQTPLSHGK